MCREDRDWIRRALAICAREEKVGTTTREVRIRYRVSTSVGHCDDSNITRAKGVVCSYMYSDGSEW